MSKKIISLILFLLIFSVIQQKGCAFGLGDPMMFSSFSSATSSWDTDNDKKNTKPSGPDFGPYFRSMQRKLIKNWELPENVNDNITVVVNFSVDSSGKVSNCVIHKSSGNAEFDKSALNAIALSQPFKSFPEDFEGEVINVQLTLNPKYTGVSRY